ncbi:hypothetical protein COLO4_23425 [Corchorus olitorius]|uniref:Uncharacterized protein n=1 Tax=Corchorus olitorius TaxID=93759 RepID=A0A1R3IGR9_9ROSI|nr:hypothetical protein COLO4_23425 [Corchorus olitorius]
MILFEPDGGVPVGGVGTAEVEWGNWESFLQLTRACQIGIFCLEMDYYVHDKSNWVIPLTKSNSSQIKHSEDK